jgi:putative ABC transport system permease protein
LGQEIEGFINDTVQFFRVNGVFKDIPINSTFRATCFVNSWWSLAPLNKSFGISDIDVSRVHDFWRTWVLLSDKNLVASLEEQFPAFEARHISANSPNHYSLQSLSDIYLHSEEIRNSGIQGDLGNIRLFSAVALLILMIAAINYTILSTAACTEV